MTETEGLGCSGHCARQISFSSSLDRRIGQVSFRIGVVSRQQKPDGWVRISIILIPVRSITSVALIFREAQSATSTTVCRARLGSISIRQPHVSRHVLLSTLARLSACRRLPYLREVRLCVDWSNQRAGQEGRRNDRRRVGDEAMLLPLPRFPLGSNYQLDELRWLSLKIDIVSNAQLAADIEIRWVHISAQLVVF